MEEVSSTSGVLAIWNNSALGQEAIYEAWYRTEHLAERVNLPGFQAGRRYRALDAEPAYLTVYETDSPDVMLSESYLERVDNPTAMTREVASGIMTDVIRTVFRKADQTGEMRGSLLVTARFEELPPVLPEIDVLVKDLERTQFLRIERWDAFPAGASPKSVEELLRGGDAKLAACCTVDTIYEADARRIAEVLMRRFGTRAQIGIYSYLCALEARDTQAVSV